MDWPKVILGFMPIYEFHCQKCEKDSEILIRSSDWKGTKCPHCGSIRLEKKLSVFASAGAEGAAAPAGPACGMGSGSGGCGCVGGRHHH